MAAAAGWPAGDGPRRCPMATSQTTAALPSKRLPGIAKPSRAYLSPFTASMILLALWLSAVAADGIDAAPHPTAWLGSYQPVATAEHHAQQGGSVPQQDADRRPGSPPDQPLGYQDTPAEPALSSGTALSGPASSAHDAAASQAVAATAPVATLPRAAPVNSVPQSQDTHVENPNDEEMYQAGQQADGEAGLAADIQPLTSGESLMAPQQRHLPPQAPEEEQPEELAASPLAAETPQEPVAEAVNLEEAPAPQPPLKPDGSEQRQPIWEDGHEAPAGEAPHDPQPQAQPDTLPHEDLTPQAHESAVVESAETLLHRAVSHVVSEGVAQEPVTEAGSLGGSQTLPLPPHVPSVPEEEQPGWQGAPLSVPGEVSPHEVPAPQPANSLAAPPAQTKEDVRVDGAAEQPGWQGAPLPVASVELPATEAIGSGGAQALPQPPLVPLAPVQKQPSWQSVPVPVAGAVPQPERPAPQLANRVAAPLDGTAEQPGLSAVPPVVNAAVPVGAASEAMPMGEAQSLPQPPHLPVLPAEGQLGWQGAPIAGEAPPQQEPEPQPASGLAASLAHAAEQPEWPAVPTFVTVEAPATEAINLGVAEEALPLSPHVPSVSEGERPVWQGAPLSVAGEGTIPEEPAPQQANSLEGPVAQTALLPDLPAASSVLNAEVPSIAAIGSGGAQALPQSPHVPIAPEQQQPGWQGAPVPVAGAVPLPEEPAPQLANRVAAPLAQAAEQTGWPAVPPVVNGAEPAAENVNMGEAQALPQPPHFPVFPIEGQLGWQGAPLAPQQRPEPQLPGSLAPLQAQTAEQPDLPVGPSVLSAEVPSAGFISFGGAQALPQPPHVPIGPYEQQPGWQGAPLPLAGEVPERAVSQLGGFESAPQFQPDGMAAGDGVQRPVWQGAALSLDDPLPLTLTWEDDAPSSSSEEELPDWPHAFLSVPIDASELALPLPLSSEENRQRPQPRVPLHLQEDFSSSMADSSSLAEEEPPAEPAPQVLMAPRPWQPRHQVHMSGPIREGAGTAALHQHHYSWQGASGPRPRDAHQPWASPMGEGPRPAALQQPHYSRQGAPLAVSQPVPEDHRTAADGQQGPGADPRVVHLTLHLSQPGGHAEPQPGLQGHQHPHPHPHPPQGVHQPLPQHHYQQLHHQQQLHRHQQHQQRYHPPSSADTDEVSSGLTLDASHLRPISAVIRERGHQALGDIEALHSGGFLHDFPHALDHHGVKGEFERLCRLGTSRYMGYLPLSLPRGVSPSSFAMTQEENVERMWHDGRWRRAWPDIKPFVAEKRSQVYLRDRLLESCALVGDSGNLLRMSYGPEIDMHQAVFRFDLAPAGGIFYRSVGSKTTHRVVNARAEYLEEGHACRVSTDCEDMLWTPESTIILQKLGPRKLPDMLRSLEAERRTRPRGESISLAVTNHMFMKHARVATKMLRGCLSLKGQRPGGMHWHNATKDKIAVSSEVEAALAALHICKHVTLYGMGERDTQHLREEPFYYKDKYNPRHKGEVFHDEATERLLLVNIARAKALRQCTEDGCLGADLPWRAMTWDGGDGEDWMAGHSDLTHESDNWTVQKPVEEAVVDLNDGYSDDLEDIIQSV